MTVVRTQINCPQCNQPIAAEVQQVFDTNQNPTAKQSLLTGQFNLANCPHCGFHGNIATPLVYHDHTKELLLTFIPPNLNLPRDEQERAIGKLINQVIDALPQEERKGYLFSPQQSLTMQGMVERILEEDGVTKEMLDRQKERMSLLQRLMAITDEEALAIVVKEEDKEIDEDFFRLISQLIEASMAQGDQASAQALSQLQQKLLPITTIGGVLKKQSEEVEFAIKSIQDEGENMTREKLLEFVLASPDDIRVNAYASIARQAMDYEFFQLLTLKIDASEGEEKARFETIREQLLDATQQIDTQIQQRLEISMQNVDILLSVDDLRNAVLQNLQAIDEFFMQALERKYHAANAEKDEETGKKIEEILQILQEVNENAQQQGSVDPAFIQGLLDADEDQREQIMKDNPERVNEQLVETLTGLMVQLDQAENTTPEQLELVEKVRQTYRLAVRMSMSANMNKKNNTR